MTKVEEGENCLICKEADIKKGEESAFWQDCLALINGRIVTKTEMLTRPTNTATMEDVRALQESRAELLQVRDLPTLIRAGIEEQKGEDEHGTE